MERALALVVAVALASAGAAQAIAPAKEGWESAGYDRCIDKADGSDPGMAECTFVEAARWDKALNSVYAQLSAMLDPDRRTALQKAERAWIAYRDAQCDFVGSEARGGTAERVFASTCDVRLTYERTRRLREDLKNEQELRR